MMNIVNIILFVTVHLFLCHNVCGIREVRLTKPVYGIRVFDTRKLFSVSENASLNVIFEEVQALTAQCWRPDETLLFKPKNDTFLSENRTTILKIPEVTRDMSLKWKCTLEDNSKRRTIYMFDIRVKAAKKIRALLGGAQQVFTASNESELEYEGSVEYLTEKGEIIDLDCSNRYDDGSVKLKYYDVNGTKIAETEAINSKDPLNFRLLARAENDRSYVDCSYLSVNQQEFAYRFIFRVRNNAFRLDDFIVTVNDRRLIPELNTVNGTDVYNYKFIYGGRLNITCEKKDKSILSEINIGSEREDNSLIIDIRDIEVTQSVYRFSVETKYLDGAHIECSARDPNNTRYMKARIIFQNDPYSDPVILGLPANDLLYQYSKNLKKWIAHYEYTPNMTLSLICVTLKDNRLRWLHGKALIPGVPKINGTKGTRFIEDTFTLDHRRITCEPVEEEGSRTSIEFHQKRDKKVLTHSEHDEDFGTRLNLIIGCLVGGLLVIITASCTYFWYKKYTHAKNVSGHFCGVANSLPVSSSPFENNEYTYITNEYNYIENEDSATVVNSLYQGSIQDYMVRLRRNTVSSSQTENHYDEIDDSNSQKTNVTKPVYAECYKDRILYKKEAITKIPTYTNSIESNSTTSYNKLQNKNCNDGCDDLQKGYQSGYENLLKENKN